VGRKSRSGTPEEVAAAQAAAPPIEWILEQGRQARMRELSLLDLNSREPITPDLPREEALRIYTATVNHPDTLFSFNESLPAKLDQMRALLHDPISVDEANALNDVLYRRRRYVDMIAWLQDDPIAWDGYFIREKFRAEEADRQLAEYLKRQDEDWAKGIRAPSKSIRDVCPELPVEILAVLERFEESRLADAKAAYLPKAKPCPRHPAGVIGMVPVFESSIRLASCMVWVDNTLQILP
jgi:hypothetical protein